MLPEGSDPNPLRVLLLSEADRAVIAREAEAAHPREGCGLLVGHVEGKGVARVTAVHGAANVLAGEHADRFELDPATRLRIQRECRARGEVVLGHWHSHPSGVALPSATDAARAFEDGLVWLIQATDPATGRAEALEGVRSTGRCGPVERAFRPLALTFFSRE
ncbi:MAG: M67 family metallopeptidase [Rhodospirillum sp.]|nr:M67 family metallopeptidase [Rhodospirillum sp.]MCF8488821.1 M67 family metallopeptidase [Rhodospirillum sp.]MCF8500903.1 M67 family metallopeptidase [Rhodospirillum sp.]